MLKLENISKYYYSNTSVVHALKNINLEFKLGEFVAITGDSGSGKTTLLNIISGLETYEDGEMYFKGKNTSYFSDLELDNYKNEISYIFQNYSLIYSYSAIENVIAAGIVKGLSYNEAKIRAKKILNEVGLSHCINKKAIKLSGGEKQRLSIARALIVDNDIIVADEPTGNLDSKTGDEILALLKKISKDKLVIVVTHNVKQIEPYATRKVRIHDGNIVIDEIVEHISEVVSEEKILSNSNGIKTISNLAFLNIKSQPRRSIILLLLFVLFTFTSFISVGNFNMNLDNERTRELSDDIFINYDDTRMLVKKQDSSVIIDDDLSNFKFDNVVSVEKYDYITDINYFRPGDYYTKHFGGYTDPGHPVYSGGFIDLTSFVLEKRDKFMRSASSIDEDMLKCGRLPENDYEMVVYSDDENILNKTELVLFNNNLKWGDDVCVQYQVKIVGILKKPTNQAYFSENICKVMELTQQSIRLSITYKYKYYGNIYQSRTVNFSTIIVDPSLDGESMSFTESSVKAMQGSMLSEYNTIFYTPSGKQELRNYKFKLDKAMEMANVGVGVSQEVFDEIYEYYKDKTQFAIFIDDYANLEKVQDEVFSNGYDSLSCYRTSLAGYDETKVIKRYVNIGISIAALLVVNIITSLIIYTIIKVKKNEYLILKIIGLSNIKANMLNVLELFIYTSITNVLLIVTTIIVKNVTGNQLIIDIFKYINWYDYLIVFVIGLFNIAYISKLFTKHLSARVKLRELKEE